MSTQLDALRAYVATRPAAAPAGAATGARAARAAGGGPTVFVVGSGKGGAGTSTVAALLALALATSGGDDSARTLLVDTDEQLGPQRLLLGLGTAPDGARGVGDLRAGGTADALLVPLGPTLTLLPGGGVDTAPFTAAERRVALARAAGAWAGHAHVVVDAGSRLDGVAAALEAALAVGAATAGGVSDAAPRVRLVVVAGDEPVALAASYALVKRVAERAPTVEARVLANRADDAAAGAILARLGEGALRFLGRPLALAGALPDDPCLASALRAGMPIADAVAGSPTATAVEAIATRLLAPAVAIPLAGAPSGAPAGPVRPRPSAGGASALPSGYAAPLPPRLGASAPLALSGPA